MPASSRRVKPQFSAILGDRPPPAGASRIPSVREISHGFLTSDQLGGDGLCPLVNAEQAVPSELRVAGVVGEFPLEGDDVAV